jgi:hypothetical protein
MPVPPIGMYICFFFSSASGFASGFALRLRQDAALGFPGLFWLAVRGASSACTTCQVCPTSFAGHAAPASCPGPAGVAM